MHPLSNTIEPTLRNNNYGIMPALHHFQYMIFYEWIKMAVKIYNNLKGAKLSLRIYDNIK